MEWNNCDILQLISEVKTKPWIWSVNHEEYKNTKRKKKTYAEIGKIFNCEGSEIERKWQVIRGQYRREREKMKQFKANGSGDEGVRPCKWFAFQYLTFLQKSSNRRKSANSKKAPVKEELKVLSQESIASCSAIDFSKNDEVEAHSSKTLFKSSRKHKIEDPQISKTYDVLQKLYSRDEYDIYGENVAVKLRKIRTERLRIQLQRDIDNLIYDALTLTGKYAKFN